MFFTTYGVSCAGGCARRSHRAGSGAGHRPGDHRDRGVERRQGLAGRCAALAVRRGHRHHRDAAAGKGSGGGTSFGFRQEIKNVRSGQIAAGTKININELVNTQYGTMKAASLAPVSRLGGVSAATGGLALTDVTVSGTVPALSAGRAASAPALPPTRSPSTGWTWRTPRSGRSARQAHRGVGAHRRRRARERRAGQLELRDSAQAERGLEAGHRRHELHDHRHRERAAERQSAGRLHPAGQGAEHRSGLGQRQAVRPGEQHLRVAASATDIPRCSG